MAGLWFRAALLGTGVGLGVADAAADEGAIAGVEMLNATEPMETASYGCLSCCRTGSCHGAYKGVPGVCCSSMDEQCCPSFFGGKAYHCLHKGYKRWSCGAGFSGGGHAPAPPPAPVHVPPPPPPPPAPVHVPPPPPPTPPPKICNRNTGGTCSLLSCKASRGATDCVSGKCVCKPGHCSLGGVCVSEASCPKSTPGSCRIFGCGSKRGEVDCVHGSCVCKKSACARDGVCYWSCRKATGGTCKHLSCKGWRGAECEAGACLCGAGLCSFGGQCMSGVRAAAMDLAGEAEFDNTTLSMELAEIQQQGLDGTLVLALAAGFVISAGLIVLIARRSHMDHEGYEALIQTGA